MRWQAFRQISTGELTNAIFSTAGDSFDPEITESRRLDIAAALGIPESDLEAIDSARKLAASRLTLILPTKAAGPTEQELFKAASATEQRLMTARKVGLAPDS